MLLKKKSRIVTLVSGLVLSCVLILTLVGYIAYIEIKNEEGELVARKFWRSYWTGRKITYPTKESYR